MRNVGCLQFERPRERLLAFGAAALSDVELVALLLRTGTSRMSALEIARSLISRFDGLAGLLAAPVAEVVAMDGVGPAKGAELATVVELARRSLAQQARKRDALASPQAVRDYLRLLLAARPYEVFVGLYLDSQNRLLAVEEIREACRTVLTLEAVVATGVGPGAKGDGVVETHDAHLLALGGSRDGAGQRGRRPDRDLPEVTGVRRHGKQRLLQHPAVGGA